LKKGDKKVIAGNFFLLPKNQKQRLKNPWLEVKKNDERKNCTNIND